MYLAINRSETYVRRAIRTFIKSELTSPWLNAINDRASTRLERQVISATSTMTVSDQNVRVQSAAKGRKLSGGLNPKTDYPAVEFGASRNKTTTYSRGGRRASPRVTRHTARQLRPRNTRGYVFYPTAEAMIPRLASLIVQTVVKGYSNIFDGKSF